MRHYISAPLHFAAVSTCAIVAIQPTYAQESREGTSNEQAGEIIVTARRAAESIQDVPVAVSVLSAEELERQRITGASDLQYSSPSLVVSTDPLGGSTAPVFQLRGQIAAQGSDDTVVTYLRDVPINSRAFAGGLFDLQSVQIIRGPQGTLFGKNSTGGAVIFTPRLADPGSISGFIDGTVGNYSYYQIGAGVNVPVILDKLAIRVSGQITRQDGFVRNISGPDGADKHYEVARVSVVATPTDALRNETFFNYFHGRQHQNPRILSAINPPFLNFLLGPQNFAMFEAQFETQQELGERAIDYSFRENSDDNDVYIVTNTTSYDFGSMTLKNIFGYYKQKPRVTLGQSSTNLPIIDVLQNKNQNQISEELQLSGEMPSLKWIFGGFYSREKTSTFQDSFLFGRHTTFSTSMEKYSTKAIYGQATYDFSSLGLNGLKLTAGVRRSWDQRSGGNIVTNLTAGGPVTQPVIESSTKFRNWSWTVGLDYQVAGDTLLYVTSRHSYKAGGLNLVSSVAPPELFTYAPEKLTDIEIGAKTVLRFGEVVIRTNAAAYRGWYKNMHFQALANCGTVGSYVVNAAKGSPKGLELEVDASVTSNLRVGGFYNRTLGKFDKFEVVQPNGCVVIGGGANLDGTDFGNISKDTASLNASYTVPLGEAYEELVLSGNWYYRSKRLGTVLQGINAAMPQYSLFNARLDYNSIGGSNFDVGIWIRNIGDKLYPVYRSNNLTFSGIDIQAYGEPRTFGIDLKYKF